ncbi:hypothetical protein [Hyalangium rubrum]|uniref:Uncharacterized protein n=1 Tax=Hyalangium rubrum TaxID=3103134 RepID=A0ABU5H5G1_9BACT|nr:hypothetical protein [Hyalangium sp. s54d21]MDY7228551.1 hypothetical protein [Hyalangium sp. s54d21]
MLNLWKTKEEKISIQTDMTLDQVRVAMRQLLMEENTNHYRMGELYNYVVKEKLAEAVGYKTAQDYFSEHLREVSRATLVAYGAVANGFTAPVCNQFGVTRLSLLLTYEEAAETEVNHAEPGGTIIEVMGETGEVTPKPFSECSVDDMRRALQRRRKPASSKPLPSEDLAIADQYMKAVTSKLPKGAPVRMQVRNHKGKPVLDFKGIPLAQVTKLAEALLAQPISMPQAKEVEQAPNVV